MEAGGNTVSILASKMTQWSHKLTSGETLTVDTYGTAAYLNATGLVVICVERWGDM